MRIRITLPEDRNYVGRIEALDANGDVILGPFVAAGRAHDQLAAAHGNALRNPLLPYGDTPLGTYAVRGVLESGPGTALDRNVFGEHGVVLLEPVSGAAALADAQGRFRLFIQGGADDEGGLCATAGAVRLLNGDQKQLVALMRSVAERVICEVVATAERGARVVTSLPPLECDPPALPDRRYNTAQPASLRSPANLVPGMLLAPSAERTGRPAARFFVMPEHSGSGGDGTDYGGGGASSPGAVDGTSSPVDTSTGEDAGVQPVVSQPVVTATDSAPSPGADLTPPPDDSVVAGMETGSTLQSVAPQTGVSSQYSPDQGGWSVAPQPVDWFTNLPATGGSLTNYVGNDVETYSGAPSDAQNANSYSGTQNVYPYFPDSQNATSSDAGGLTASSQSPPLTGWAAFGYDGPPPSDVSAPDLLALNNTPNPANVASDVGGPNYIGPVDSSGQSATASSTDVTYDGVVYHLTGTGTINGQAVNSYEDDSGTRWLNLAAEPTPPSPAVPVPNTSQVSQSSGSFQPDMGVHQLTPDEQAALVNQYAQYDAQLASQANQPAVAPSDQSSTSFDTGTLPPIVGGQTSLPNTGTPQQGPLSYTANALGSTAPTSAPSSPSDPGFGNILGASGINAGLAAMRDAFTPMSPMGTPLQGPLNLYTGDARTLAESASDGYLIRNTAYYGPADAAEQALRSLPETVWRDFSNPDPGRMLPDLYNPIWDAASRNAVIDATLSGQGVTSYNDLSTLARESIQARVELPWLRGLGSGVGVLQVGGGVLTIVSATDPNLPGPLVPVAAVSGSLQLTGGLAYVIGAWGADGAMMAAGAGVAETGGLLGIPLAAYGLGVAIESGTTYTIDSMVRGQIQQDADAARFGSTTGELPPSYINNGPTGDPLNDFFP